MSEEPKHPFDKFLWHLRSMMMTCRAFGMGRETGNEVFAVEFKRMCEEHNLDVCVALRGATATEPPVEQASDDEPQVQLMPRGKFIESICEAMSGKWSMLELNTIIDNALAESGMKLTDERPEVTVTKTEAGNTVISDAPPGKHDWSSNAPATGGAIAETVVNTDVFKEAVREIVSDRLLEEKAKGKSPTQSQIQRLSFLSSKEFADAIGRALEIHLASDDFKAAVDKATGGKEFTRHVSNIINVAVCEKESMGVLTCTDFFKDGVERIVRQWFAQRGMKFRCDDSDAEAES